MLHRVTLEVIRGPGTGSRYTFYEEEPATFWAGWDPACNLRIADDDRNASRFHFSIAVDPPEADLRDQGSRTGTWVNGNRRGRHDNPMSAAVPLSHGDRVKAGAMELVIRVDRVVETAPRSPQCDGCGVDIATTGKCASCATSGHPAMEQVRLALGISDAGPAWLSYYDVSWNEELGKGTFGAVHPGKRRRDGRDVAVKLVHDRTESTLHHRLSVAREISVQAALRHPNIVEVLDYGAFKRSGQRGLFVVMERCDGGTLSSMMRTLGRTLSMQEACGAFLDVLSGLAEAHARGIVHRDVKPSNILFQSGPDGAIAAKLADFGLAKSLAEAGHSSMTGWRMAKGTLGFAPWEQVNNAKYADERCDVFAAAATLFYAITGKTPRPSPGADARPLLSVLPSAPTALAAMMDKALAREPSDRFANAADLREALISALP